MCRCPVRLKRGCYGFQKRGWGFAGKWATHRGCRMRGMPQPWAWFPVRSQKIMRTHFGGEISLRSNSQKKLICNSKNNDIYVGYEMPPMSQFYAWCAQWSYITPSCGMSPLCQEVQLVCWQCCTSVLFVCLFAVCRLLWSVAWNRRIAIMHTKQTLLSSGQ